MPQFTTENVCYVKHGERQIMARVFKPEGAGPFPCFIDLHGGAWNNGDLNDRTGLGEYLAARGTVMVTLNFRHAADGYPTSCADINYGIRWTKAHAKELKVDPAKVFIGGASSGGHLAMLVAMRPNDARYAAIPGPAAPGVATRGAPAASAAGENVYTFNITGATDPEAVARQIKRIVVGHEVRVGLAT